MLILSLVVWLSCCISVGHTANYNGTCPTSFDAPLVGEVLSAPAKACDYSLTVGDGPDFFVTSQVAGACQKNLKVYVHATCIKNDNTYASGLLSALPSLPSLSSLPKMLPVSAGLLGGVPAGSGSSADAPTGLMTGSSAVLGGLMDSRPALGAANTGAMRAHPGLYSSEPGVLEQAKQSGAADVKPALFKAAAAAAAAAVLALAL